MKRLGSFFYRARQRSSEQRRSGRKCRSQLLTENNRKASALEGKKGGAKTKWLRK
jgi:hypothetical protein